MLLVIDVGNTNTSLGIYEVGRLRASWRLTTRREQTADEWGVAVRRIGRVESGAGAFLEEERGMRAIDDLGHDHFGVAR